MAKLEPKTLNAKEAGQMLGVSRGVVYRLIHDGTIPALRLGKKLRVPVAALEKMLQDPRPIGQQERQR